jgi:divalent metal cation (Fe/Co/Zn/Cd) transporter
MASSVLRHRDVTSDDSAIELHDAETQNHVLDGCDPFRLASRIQSREVIPSTAASFRQRKHWFKWIDRLVGKDDKVEDFYKTQNTNIRRLLKTVDEHEQEATDEQGATNLRYKIAVNGSLVANVILSGLQLYGAISSGSLSLFTTMADSIFDPLSGVLLLLSHRAVKKVDPRKFPSGRARISTAGNIVFSFIMFSVSMILIVLSCTDIARGSEKETNDFHYPAVIAVSIAFATKLGLFFFCWPLKDTYSQVGILWQDHRNDLFINGFGILTSVGGSKLKWWIDPMGAIVLSVLIVYLWLGTAYEEFQLLIGITADPETLQLITYIGMLCSTKKHRFVFTC